MTAGIAAFFDARSPDDALGSAALRPRRADVVRVEGVDQARPQLSRQRRRGPDAQRDRGQHDVLEPLPRIILELHPADGGEPPEVDGEDRDQHHRQPEVRDRDAHARRADPDLVPDASGFGGGQDAERHTEQDADHDRAQREAQRDRELVGDLRAHRLSVDLRVAEIELDGVLQPAPVLRDQWVVEAELLADTLDLLRARVHTTGDRRRRVTRQEVREREHRERHHQQERDQREQPPDDQAEHTVTRGLTMLLRSLMTVSYFLMKMVLKSGPCSSGEIRVTPPTC